MNRFWIKSGVVAVTTAWSLAAFAQSTSSTVPSSAIPADNKSVTEAEVAGAKSKGLPISIAADSTVFGPRVNTPTDNKITGDEDDRTSFKSIFLRQKFPVKYKIDAKTAITPTLEFDYQLTDHTISKEKIGEFRWRDAYVKLSRAGLFEQSIKGNDVALDSDLRLYVPTSKRARHNQTLGAARLSLNPSVQFAKSPFSVSVTNYAKYWFQRQDNDGDLVALPMAELYTGPQLNYAFNDAVTAFVLFETFVGYDTSGMPTNSTAPTEALADFEPGVSMQLHERVNLTPYLHWNTIQPLHYSTLNLNAVFTLL